MLTVKAVVLVILTALPDGSIGTLVYSYPSRTHCEAAQKNLMAVAKISPPPFPMNVACMGTSFDTEVAEGAAL